MLEHKESFRSNKGGEGGRQTQNNFKKSSGIFHTPAAQQNSHSKNMSPYISNQFSMGSASRKTNYNWGGLAYSNNGMRESTMSNLTSTHQNSNQGLSTVHPLTNDEKLMYGNRCPKGYKKSTLLGRGGCALVWLAIDENTN
jgi:hypothetical protein